MAGVSFTPRKSNITEFNKDLRPISLTFTLSKIAQDFVVNHALKPKLLSKIDPISFDLFPYHVHATLAIISMLHLVGWPRQKNGQVLQ